VELSALVIIAAVQGIGGNAPLLAFLASSTPTATATMTPTPTFTLTPVPTNTVTPVPTETAQPSATNTTPPTATEMPTLIPTDVPTSTQTLTPSQTLRPTITLTPSITPTATLDITLTLIQATLISDFQTATVNACDFNYTIVSQDPADEDYAAANSSYEREITLRNIGSCAWERNTISVNVFGG
jgi:hypothetical protein